MAEEQKGVMQHMEQNNAESANLSIIPINANIDVSSENQKEEEKKSKSGKKISKDD